MATTWGCNHEKYTRDCYVEKVSENHSKFTVSDKGLVIHPNFPQFGASPDGLINCDCCGCGVLEIKCPYSCIGRCFLEASKDKFFCLEVSDQGNLTLKRKHAYFYQLQLQMKLCNVEHGYFVIWRPDELLILRILRDDMFLNDTMDKATKFFTHAVLPELIAKWYTRVPSNTAQDMQQGSSQTSAENTETERKWCYCNGENYGKMIGCDNKNCSIQWFHVKCLGHKRIPKQSWYCPNCRSEQKK